MPETWYAEGGNANRATSDDQTDVAFKTLEAAQASARRVFTLPLSYAYDNLAEKQVKFPKRSTGGVRIEVDLVPVRERDLSRAAATAVQLETTLESAVAAEFVSKKTSRKVFLQVIEKLSGTTLDPDDEEVQILAERAERENAEAQRQADAARRGLEDALDDGTEAPAAGAETTVPPPEVA
jgi:hypothetical protein